MAGIAPASVPRDSSEEPGKNQDAEKRQRVTEASQSSLYNEEREEHVQHEAVVDSQGQRLEPASTLGTIMSRMRSRASMVIEPPPDGGFAAWMVGEYSQVTSTDVPLQVAD